MTHWQNGWSKHGFKPGPQTTALAREGQAAMRAKMVARGEPIGFQALDPEELRARASEGGKAAHAPGRAKRAHEWSVDEARAAGVLGRIARRNNAALRAMGQEPTPAKPSGKHAKFKRTADALAKWGLGPSEYDEADALPPNSDTSDIIKQDRVLWP